MLIKNSTAYNRDLRSQVCFFLGVSGKSPSPQKAWDRINFETKEILWAEIIDFVLIKILHCGHIGMILVICSINKRYLHA